MKINQTSSLDLSKISSHIILTSIMHSLRQLKYITLGFKHFNYMNHERYGYSIKMSIINFRVRGVDLLSS